MRGPVRAGVACNRWANAAANGIRRNRPAHRPLLSRESTNWSGNQLHLKSRMTVGVMCLAYVIGGGAMRAILIPGVARAKVAGCLCEHETGVAVQRAPDSDGPGIGATHG